MRDAHQHREAERALVRAAEDGERRGVGVGDGVRVGLASHDGALLLLLLLTLLVVRLRRVGLVLGKLGRLMLARDHHHGGDAPGQREEEGETPAPRKHLLVRRERLDHAHHQLRHDEAAARRRQREAGGGRRVGRPGALDGVDHRGDDFAADEEALAELEQ